VTSFGTCGAACVSSFGIVGQTAGSKPVLAAATTFRSQLRSEHSCAVVRSPSTGRFASAIALSLTAAISVPAAGPLVPPSRRPTTTKRASERVSPGASEKRCP
jgi:hypothetical protein